MFAERFRDFGLAVTIIVGAATSLATYSVMQGTRVFRALFAVLRGAIFGGIFYLPLLSQPRLSSVPAVPVVGASLFGIGVLLVVLGGRQLAQAGLQGLEGTPERLVTTGLYGLVRHPVNLGLLCSFTGWYMMWSGTYSLLFVVLLDLALLAETRWEERRLEAQFGDVYRAYKRRVGMFFPRISARRA